MSTQGLPRNKKGSLIVTWCLEEANHASSRLADSQQQDKDLDSL